MKNLSIGSDHFIDELLSRSSGANPVAHAAGQDIKVWVHCDETAEGKWQKS